MLHNYLHPFTTSSAHWAVNVNCDHNKVLVQLNDGKDEVRVALSDEQADDMMFALVEAINLIRREQGKDNLIFIN